MQEAKRESAARHAEGAALRSALREIQANSPGHQALVSMQHELSQLRSVL